MNKPSWKTLTSSIAYKTPYITVRKDSVIRPDGKETTFDVIERSDFVVVIAKKEHTFVLVDQYRYPIKKRSLEFPEGSIDEGETPEEAAKRELIEETGLRSNSWKKLGYLYLGNGSQTQGFYIFLAEECTKGEREMLGEEADLIMKEATYEELTAALTSGAIHDGPTMAAFCLYLLKDNV